MSHHSHAFDRWIRGRFVELNTELEYLYDEKSALDDVEALGGDIKTTLRGEGLVHIRALLEEGNTDEGFDRAFEVLGNVGFYMAACRRHLLTEPSREKTSPLKEASALAMHLGASLGMTPRFATSHLTTHNRAIGGTYKCFTNLPDEKIFLDYNTLGIVAFKQAADALMQILPLGISHPITATLLKHTTRALKEVYAYNLALFEKLDVTAFFYHIRPYYKPFRVGLREYRGANAGDFAGINIVDMLLGLCQANNASYSQLLVDKFLYMRPEDQIVLRECMRQKNLLDCFLECTPEEQKKSWYKSHLSLFLEACEAHARTAQQHHDQLVSRFIQGPSESLDNKSLEHITASGPPLAVLIDSLEKLRDLRMAAARDDIPSRYRDLDILRATL